MHQRQNGERELLRGVAARDKRANGHGILTREATMQTSTILKAVGIVLVCVGIHFGISALLPLIVFGAGLGFLFLP